MSDSLPGRVAGLIDRVEDVELRTENVKIRDVSQLDGELPWSVKKTGPWTILHGSTAKIAAGGSATVYLTVNRGVGGEALFKDFPVALQVLEDGTGDGLPRVRTPVNPSGSFGVRDRNLHTFEVKWLPNDKRFVVIVTNNDTAAHDYAIVAAGV